MALLKKFLWLCSFFWLLAGQVSVLAQDSTFFLEKQPFPVYNINDEQTQVIELGSKVGMLVDRTSSLTIEQVLEPFRIWEKIQSKTPNFGFTRHAYWFRFQINNTSNTTQTRYIELPITFIDDIHFYHFHQQKQITQYTLGDNLPFAQRPVRNPHFVMPVELPVGSNHIYIRLASSGTIEAPFRIWKPQPFFEHSNELNLMQGALAGILLIMIAYNAVVYLITRDTSYLYYIGFVASFFFFHFSLNGYAFAYLWPNWVYWNSFSVSTFIACTELFACLFAINFLKLKRFSKLAYYIMYGLVIYSAVLIVLTFILPYSITIRMGSAAVFPVSILSLAFGYWRWYKGAKFARIYCLAWTAILAGVGILVSGKYGIIPSNFYLNIAHEIGAVLLVLLLSITLADRINHDRKLRIRAHAVALAHERRSRAAQEALIQSKEEANMRLEQRVKERTTDLNKAMHQLKLANDQLQRLAKTDGLTKVCNRAFFDKAFFEEYRRAQRTKVPLSLIILDIDFFKKINDTYGHPGGDACLRAIAALIQPKVNRAGDILARFGGEEFVILLPDCSLENAVKLAETLREEIEQLIVPFEDKEIRFTSSFGVACGMPDTMFTTEDLLTVADKALYQAKRDGRNRVKTAADCQP